MNWTEELCRHKAVIDALTKYTVCRYCGEILAKPWGQR